MGIEPSYAVLARYFTVALVLALLSAFRAWRVFDRTVDKAFVAALIVAGCVIAGAFDLGTDAPAYHEYYKGLGTANRYAWWEPGFELFALTFARMDAPYGLFVAFAFLISYAIKLIVYNRVVANLLFACFILFCLDIGEVAFVREYLAASLTLLFYYLLMRKQVFLAVMVMLLAASCHKSALVASLFIVVIAYGYKSLYPLVLAAAAGYLAYLLIPAALFAAIQGRVFAQTARYVADGYVQGIVSEQMSFARNILKFGFYILFALWMVFVPIKTEIHVLQRKAAHIIIALSMVSAGLISISPVFSRLSPYIFVFMPLSVRAERLEPALSLLISQALAVALLLCYLAIATYPLAKYL